ncbi:probable carboxylesterase 2 [Amborella trichopoda]|uniref:probable carboxylesterase 2 n=1 Tax=Amborella trichopoda TaxID=13333 RepID=UPI0005D3224C|nr:probable carboxylesterase 2 [Amborella trichopoda]|eukprot:XP_011622365.1 probable carboxylesterase 2 [Amborella trichopoda]
MESSAVKEIEIDLSPYIRLYKDGTVDRLAGNEILPASLLSESGASSKDVTISRESGISARLYLPSSAGRGQKLPTLVYFHGGAFIIESPFSPLYHPYTESVSANSKALVVSIDYHRPPEHPLPAAYEDAWAALLWVVSRVDPWLGDYADLSRIFVGGDSAGANIAHHVALRAGTEGSEELKKLRGLILMHPYFWSSGLSEEERERGKTVGQMWKFACPDSEGVDDLWINPMAKGSEGLRNLGCEKVLICVAGKDFLKGRGVAYGEALRRSGWEGAVEVAEDEGEDHVFHLFNPERQKSKVMMERVSSFLED